MHQEHFAKKKRRMTMTNCRRIQEARVKRNKPGWSKFVLRVIKHETSSFDAKYDLPHIVPLTRQQRQVEDAKRRAKNRDELIAELTKLNYTLDFIATIVGPA